MTLLPQDQAFLELLQEKHGVTLTPEELGQLNEFHFYLRSQNESRLANNPDDVFYEVHNGKILGILAFAAIGFFAAPLLGVGGIVGALMGAAIGWRLFGQDKKEEEQKEAKQSTNYGFDGLTGLPNIGGAIPLIYCNRAANPNGGVLASGFCVHSRVETSKGTQKIYQLFVFGLGQIGEIDVSKTLVNDQPLDNFFSGDVIINTALGSTEQLPFDDFSYYCQSVSPAANNQMGVDSKVRIDSASGNTITLKEDDKDNLDNFTPSDTYRIEGQDFRVTSKQGDRTLITNIATPLSLGQGAFVSAIYNAKYTTTKPVNQIDININAIYWARKEDKKKGSVLVKHAGAFDLFVKNETNGIETYVFRFGIQSSSLSNLRRVLKIKNLPYGKYTINIKAVDYTVALAEGRTAMYLLEDTGNFIDYAFNGYLVTLEGGSFADIKDALSPVDKTQIAQQGNAPATITSINEIVFPESLGQPRVVGYPGLSIASFVGTASNQLQGNPNLKFLITQGRSEMKVLVHSGTCTEDNASILVDVFRGIGATAPGHIVRNLNKRLQSTVVAINSGAGHIATTQPILWNKGDRWVSFGIGCSNYFPDIYLDTLTSINGGLGNYIDGDYFVDYDSIVDSKNFCVANGYFWDGTIAAPVPWSQWATKESMGSLLFPSRINGRFALLFESIRNPVALFNASNIIADSFTEEFAERQELNSVVITYKDGSDAKFKPITTNVMTGDSYNGVVPIVEESISLEAITNSYQSTRVGQVYLKTRLLQDRAINFKTGLQGSYLQPGDLIIVQHLITQFDSECSGFALESQYLLDGNGTPYFLVRLSSEVQIGIEPNSYSCAIFYLENGAVQKNLTVYSDNYGTDLEPDIRLLIYGAGATINAPSENRTGDYIVVSKNIVESRTYKIGTVAPQSSGEVGITGVLFIPSMLNSDGLITVN